MNSHTRTLIMAVPWEVRRLRSAARLRKQTGGEPIWDTTHNAWDTWLSVLAAAGDDAVVILEDDVDLAQNWRERVEGAIAQHPESVIQFFSNRKADRTVGSRWEAGRTFSMNQCYYLPAGTAAALAAFAPGWHDEHPEHPTGYDLTMADWLKGQGQRYWVHVPSLVQHHQWRSEINPRRSSARQSSTFEGTP